MFPLRLASAWISFFAEVNSFQFLAKNHGTMVLIKVLSVLITHWTVLHMELEFAPLLLVIIIFICHFMAENRWL